MLFKQLLCGVGLTLGLTLAAGCCHHAQSTPCNKPAVVNTVPIVPPPPPPCGCPTGPGAVVAPAPIPPGTLPPAPPPGPFTPSSQSGVIVPQPY
jgi:hypothetical protein